MVARDVNRWSTLNGLRSDVDRLFEAFVPERAAWGMRPAAAYPPLNVWEDEEHLYVEAELPGVKMDDIELLIDGEELHIKGARKAEEVEGANYHRRERGVGGFSRSVHLPFAVDSERVGATLRNGVLLIALPKAPEVKPRRIEVTSA